MRILNLISSTGLYGAERVVIELSGSLLGTLKAHPVVGIISNSYNPCSEVVQEAKKHDLETIVFPSRKQFDVSAISAIRNFLKNNKIDLLHCHGYKSNLYGLLASRRDVPTVTTNHNWLKSDSKLMVYCFLDSLWIRLFDKIIAVSDEIKQEMIRYRIPAKKIDVIDNGIDFARFSNGVAENVISKEFGLDREARVIGTIGSLSQVKGHKCLLYALQNIIRSDRRVVLAIVGDGPLEKDLKQLASDLDIRRNVLFLGFRNDIPAILSSIDIFVLPSLKEGLPVALLEAMASAKPVIATRVGAVERVMTHDKDGVLVAPGDVPMLEKSIAAFLAAGDRARELGIAASAKVRAQFSAERMCGRYFEVYSQLLKTNTSQPSPDSGNEKKVQKATTEIGRI